MNLASPSQVRAWCIERGFHPSRRLGQNFLVDRNVLDAVLRDSGVQAGQRVLEIGAGLGILTAGLLSLGARVVAVEKDPRLAEALGETLGSRGGLELRAADALELDLDRLLAGGFDAMVSNLPYAVGSRILMELARHPLSPPRLTVMVQHEVATRLAAGPGTAEYGLLGIWVQRRYDVALTRTVAASCFWPRPEVSSAVVRMDRHDRLPLDPAALARFEALTRLAFAHRRKQLAATLRRAPAGMRMDDGKTLHLLAACGAPPRARPEDLSPAQWCTFARRA
jgi:16S rRNA (adenine1518-N6/adenine1519-N6)-dimethyltransferase